MITLEEKPGKGGHHTATITLSRTMSDAHSVFFLKSYHHQVWSCIIRIITSPTIRKCSGLSYSIHLDVNSNGLKTITLYINEEDIFPRHGSGKYSGIWVVSIPDVCDNIRKYQSTTVPGTMRRQN